MDERKNQSTPSECGRGLGSANRTYGVREVSRRQGSGKVSGHEPGKGEDDGRRRKKESNFLLPERLTNSEIRLHYAQ